MGLFKDALCDRCVAFADSYAKFQYLWVKDIEECFQDFKYKETEEYKAIDEEERAKGVAPPPDAVPTLVGGLHRCKSAAGITYIHSLMY